MIKKKIKTLKELNSFNGNKSEIQRQIRVLGLGECSNDESFADRFQRELDKIDSEHKKRLKKIKWIMRGWWIIFGIGLALQIIALILK